MKVADIMEPAVRSVTVDTPVSEVVVSLADAQVTGLPVLDARNRVVGVVSSTDLISAQAETQSAEERQILLKQTPVRDIMTPEIVYCFCGSRPATVTVSPSCQLNSSAVALSIAT